MITLTLFAVLILAIVYLYYSGKVQELNTRLVDSEYQIARWEKWYSDTFPASQLPIRKDKRTKYVKSALAENRAFLNALALRDYAFAHVAGEQKAPLALLPKRDPNTGKDDWGKFRDDQQRIYIVGEFATEEEKTPKTDNSDKNQPNKKSADQNGNKNNQGKSKDNGNKSESKVSAKSDNGEPAAFSKTPPKDGHKKQHTGLTDGGISWGKLPQNERDILDKVGEIVGRMFNPSELAYAHNLIETWTKQGMEKSTFVDRLVNKMKTT